MQLTTRIAKSVNPQPGDVYVNGFAPNVAIAFFQTQGGLHDVFASLPVDLQTGIIPKLSRADTMRVQTQPKAPAALPAQTGFGTDLTSTYRCDVYELEYPMSAEMRANYALPIEAVTAATQLLARAAYLNRELRWVTNFFSTGVWGTDSTPSTTWDDPSSDPIADIETGIETILKATGYRPNVLALGYQVWKALKQHPDIISRIGTGSPSDGPIRNISRQQVAALFGLDEVRVGEVTYNTAADGAAASMSFAAGKNALLCYRTPSPSILTPSAGYAVKWRGLTGSMEGVSVYNGFDDRRQEYWYQIKHADDFKVTASEMGYFFSNAVA